MEMIFYLVDCSTAILLFTAANVFFNSYTLELFCCWILLKYEYLFDFLGRSSVFLEINVFRCRMLQAVSLNYWFLDITCGF